MALIWDQIKQYNAWLQFDTSMRLETYSAIETLLRNQVRLTQAIDSLITIYQPTSKHASPHPIYWAMQEARTQLDSGVNFAESLKGWIPTEEFGLLYASELAGKLADGFAQASKLILKKQAISRAFLSGIAYPILLFGLAGALLYMVATQVVPQFAKVVDIKKWRGASYVLLVLSNFVVQYGLFTVVMIFLIVTLVATSLPYWTGAIRKSIDAMIPWSIFKKLQGALFLLNISALLQAEQQLDSALLSLHETAHPWLKERIEAIRNQIAQGKNFGEALLQSGYDFPDRQTNQFLAVIAQYSGLGQTLETVGERTIDNTMNVITVLCNSIGTLGLLVVGGVMILVIIGAGGIQNALQSSTGGASL